MIDPLDGTTNYAHGVPIFAVLVALERAGVVELGVGYDPSRDECFVAERGRGATINGAPIRVSRADTLDQALLVTGFPYDIRTTAVTNLPEYAELSIRAQAVRRLGCAVYGPVLGGVRRARGLLGVLAWRVGHGGGRPHSQRGRRPRHGRTRGPKGKWSRRSSRRTASCTTRSWLASATSGRRGKAMTRRPWRRHRGTWRPVPHPFPVHVRTIRIDAAKVVAEGRSGSATAPPRPRQPRGPAAPRGVPDWIPARRRRHSPHGGDADRDLAEPSPCRRSTARCGHSPMSASVRMPCRRYQGLVGVTVGRGFARAVNERIGRERGCTHVAALVEAIGAVFVVAPGRRGRPSAGRQPADAPRAAVVRGFPVQAWREDGPLHRAWRAGEMPARRLTSRRGCPRDSSCRGRIGRATDPRPRGSAALARSRSSASDERPTHGEREQPELLVQSARGPSSCGPSTGAG